MSPASLKLMIAAVAVALILAISATWKVQDWRYSGRLAEQTNSHLSDLAKIRQRRRRPSSSRAGQAPGPGATADRQ